jgi:hypothetical protein
MPAVAAEQHYIDLFLKNPGNRARLLDMDAARFMTQMKMWGDFLARAGDAARFPVTGLDTALLSRIQTPTLCVFVMDEAGKDDGMHTLAAMRALHACLPGAAGRELVVTHDKDRYCAAIDAFAAGIAAPLAPPQSPSFSARSAALCAVPGMYSHLPNDAELAQFAAYYGKVAADNAAEAELEAERACSCAQGPRAWLPSIFRTKE